MKEVVLSLSEKKILNLISPLKDSPGVFLDTNYPDKENLKSYLFIRPVKILLYRLGQDLESFFKEVESFLNKGFWACGYFSYEFGYLFELNLERLLNSSQLKFPLAWLGVFKGPLIIEHKKVRPSSNFYLTLDNSFKLTKANLNMTLSEYTQAVKRIKNYLKKGDTYQVNFTLKYKAKFSGDILKFYLQLRRNQPTPYSCFINDGKNYIFSFSPELFFRINRNNILVKPMKGTHKRGRFLEEDDFYARFLRNDPKNRAENLMIVDLLRNDLGKIAKPGSVKVESLFAVEKYPTLFQMTSTIKAKLKRNTSLKDIFKALYPSGSVTGAPKIRTMQIIKSLEKEPRYIYTGSIGFISPERVSCFNVAIRTLVIRRGSLELGVGGGIVYDSQPQREYQECLLKASFLEKREQPFFLIESLLYQQGKFWLLNYHLRRLKKSCQYFNISLNLKELREKLNSFSKRLSFHQKYKIRLLVDKQGKVKISSAVIRKIKEPLLVKISSEKTDPQNPFLYHKTTCRQLYEQEKKKARLSGFFEVIFTNKKGQITEGTISNIFLLNRNKFYTPSLNCGLLGGVLREHLLKTKKAQEKNIYLDDLLKAKRVFLGNSVRGLIPARIILEKNRQDGRIYEEGKS
ncbi:MAG: aminodeoxychorismate synthase component I [Candidatus Omnitrophota bacterium]|nr:MAG: aminodeoxychorismate synthase component I [Candidatus Omnitrophota bacterium]